MTSVGVPVTIELAVNQLLKRESVLMRSTTLFDRALAHMDRTEGCGFRTDSAPVVPRPPAITALALIGQQLPYDDRRIAGHDGVRRNVLRHHGAGRHDAPLSYGDAAHNDRTCADPRVIIDFNWLVVEGNIAWVARRKYPPRLLMPL